MKRAIVFAVLLLTSFAGAFTPASAQEEQQNRLALVIGQSAYEGRALATAANDAGLIAQALTSAGFEVIQGRDLNANDLRRVVRDFLDKAQALPSDGSVVVYLSGYGLQLEGENYLLPVDARIQRDVDVPIDGFRLSDLVRSLERTPAQGRIIMADMTRDYPLPAGGDPLARGLALMDPPAGFLIAFSSAPNITNGDAPGPYGHYATALAEMMRQPGVPVDEMFNRVRLRTHETTKGLQTPWHKANLGNAPFTFFEAEGTASALPPAPQVRRIEEVPAEEAYNIAVERDTIQDYQAFLRRYPDHPLARRVSALLAARREAIVWRQTVTRNTSEAYWTYLRRYPNGPHAPDSRRRLARLSAPVAPPQVFEEVVYEDLPPPLPAVETIEVVEVVTIIREAPPPPRPPVYLLPAYEDDDEFVTIIREPPPPPIMVGVLPIPSPLPLPRYARPPRYYYEPIAPVTPRGPVALPVRTPGIGDPLFGRGEPSPPRGRRPMPPIPRQPGLTAEPKPIPVVTRPERPPVARPGERPPVQAPRLPSRPIPVVRPTPAERPQVIVPAPGAVDQDSVQRPQPVRPARSPSAIRPANEDTPPAPRVTPPDRGVPPVVRRPDRDEPPVVRRPDRDTPPVVRRPERADSPVVRRPAPEPERPVVRRPTVPTIERPAPRVEGPRAAPMIRPAQPSNPVVERPRPAPAPVARPAPPVVRPPVARPEARPAPAIRPAVQAPPPANKPQACVPGRVCLPKN
nr:caspase family protein [Microvirga solisilvae]